MEYNRAVGQIQGIGYFLPLAGIAWFWQKNFRKEFKIVNSDFLLHIGIFLSFTTILVPKEFTIFLVYITTVFRYAIDYNYMSIHE